MSGRGFVPRSKRQQLAGIGLSDNARTLHHTEDYDVRPKRREQQFFDSLRSCIDPAGGDWEDLEPPQSNEWLDSMLDKTPDQSFQQYVASRPNRPDRSRNVLYLQPICEPSDLEGPAYPEGPWPSWRVLVAAAESFFAPLKVRTLPAVPMTQLSPRPQSRQGSWGIKQWHAGMALDALVGRVPRDAYGLMAVTMCDLYPRPEWNFVYGLARLTARVGIFSFVRHTPEASGAPEAWLGGQLLHSSLKTLLHEIGHMFGLKHCTWYNCLMRGSNGAEVEHQTNPLTLCPVCLRKLQWCIGFDIRERYAGLLEVYQEHAASHELFAQDCAFLQARLAKLEELPEGATRIAALPPSRGFGMEPRSVSTTSVAQNQARKTSLSRIGKSSLRMVQTAECACCDPGQEGVGARRKNFDAVRANKILEEFEDAQLRLKGNMSSS